MRNHSRIRPPMVERARRRRRSRGAVVFIVASTLALLALMGVYAISGSAAEVRSSGYVRQAAQAHYLSEYAMAATASYVNATNADFIVSSRLLGAANGPFPPTHDCVSVPTYTTPSNLSRACVRFNQEDFERTYTGRPLLTDKSLGLPGKSLMQGRIFAEFSNPTLTQPPPGFDLALGLAFARVTVTTGGDVRPAGNDGARTLEMGRARMIVGPVRRN
jgi:hypothetical protein